MITANNVTLTYGPRQILKDINLRLEPGQVGTVIGPSGSGKTSLLRALSLLDFPQSGTIAIDEQVYVFPRKRLLTSEMPWPKVTVVFQDLYLWPHLTLRENVLLPFRLNGTGDRETALKELENLINRLGLEECIDRRPHGVSGGEKQRTAVARAVLLHPKYLLLDEITSALDIEQVAVVLDLLADLKALNMAMIIVSHHIEFAKRVSDYVYFLDDGRIVESGPSAILENPKSQRLVQFLDFVKKAR